MSKHFVTSALTAVLLWCLVPAHPVSAVNISTRFDVDLLRPAMPNEGYLSFHSLFITSPFGEERSGWTDARHPANDGTRNTRATSMGGVVLGYDRSDNFVQVHNKILTIRNMADTANEMATPNIARDFNYANQIFAQAGISVLSTGTENVNFGAGRPPGTPLIQAPIDVADRTAIQQRNRQAEPTINNWYGTSGVSGTGGVLRGVTRGPTAGAGPPNTSGTMIFNNAANDTFAHEVGHFLLNPPGGFTFAGGDPTHSPNLDDLMAAGDAPAGGRMLPDNSIKPGTGTLLADRLPNDPRIGAPRQPGRPNGANLGTVDHFNAPVTPPGGGAAGHQIRAIHESSFVQRNLLRPFAAGDRADFDWVEDNIPLEQIGGLADNHPRAGGARDPMVWNIGTILTSPHLAFGHDHADWGELALGAFTGNFFRTIDVVSQVSRYVDMDIRGGNWSAREAALDYFVEFSADEINWTRVLDPINVFIPGWTDRSDADNWVARWVSPFDARFSRILAVPLGMDSHDGNTQIDAIIASSMILQSIPEPSTWILMVTGVLGLMGYGWRRQERTRGMKGTAFPGTTPTTGD